MLDHLLSHVMSILDVNFLPTNYVPYVLYPKISCPLPIHPITVNKDRRMLNIRVEAY